MSFNIAIDGPAGAGKSTIAKKLAEKLQFIYVDTGAMYRALAYFFLENQINCENEAIISEKVTEANVSIQYENGEQQVLLNGNNINAFIRSEEVGNAASKTSAYKAVRTHLLQLQQNIAKEQNVIMDGRDIGTCVLPHADVKVFLTASVEARAKRRYDQLCEKGQAANLEEIAAGIKERDERDCNRENAPLKQADDAVLIDSSSMTIEEVVNAISTLVNEKR